MVVDGVERGAEAEDEEGSDLESEEGLVGDVGGDRAGVSAVVDSLLTTPPPTALT